MIAHDWGTNTGWSAVRLRPDRFVGMFAVSVPWASDWTPADDELIARLRWPTVRALKPGIRFPTFRQNAAEGSNRNCDRPAP